MEKRLVNPTKKENLSVSIFLITRNNLFSDFFISKELCAIQKKGEKYSPPFYYYTSFTVESAFLLMRYQAC